MEAAGLEFEVLPSPAEEMHDAKIPASELCERNAELKAAAVAEQHPGAVVIGADTLVFLDGEPLGKPRDLEDARDMLRRLGGRTHFVCTGVCVVGPDGVPMTFHERTEVRFRPLDDLAIDAYFRVANPLDKAGAYGIQEHGELLVEEIRGGYDNVMGLPVAGTLERIREVMG